MDRAPVEPSQQSYGVSAADFRKACGLFPTGVTVVTRLMPSGHPHGMTVSSFTSVSIRPPLILVCIDQRSGFLADLASGQYIGVNVLSEAQQSLAVRFATVADEGRFSGVPWNSGLEGIPMLAGTVAAFACSVQNLVPAGDHVILVARPEQIHRHGGNPLVWCHSSYHCLPGSVL